MKSNPNPNRNRSSGGSGNPDSVAFAVNMPAPWYVNSFDASTYPAGARQIAAFRRFVNPDLCLFLSLYWRVEEGWQWRLMGLDLPAPMAEWNLGNPWSHEPVASKELFAACERLYHERKCGGK